MRNPAPALLRRTFGPVIDSLKSFDGNARVCILVEPLWGIPYNLFVPYASLYMLALGVGVTEIGTVAAVCMALQTFSSLSAGWITDRLGRRRTSLIFDTLSWSLPTLLWAFAGGFSWFLIAAVFNSLGRIVHISWTCLFIEDSRTDSRVRLYAWIAVAGTLSGFFAPIAGLLVGGFGIVSGTRILYVIAFVMMTFMFLLRNALVVETSIGKIKLEEAKTKKLRSALSEYGAVFASLVRSRAAVVAFLLAVLSNIHLMVRNNFLSVVMTKGIGLPASMIAVFPPLASAITLSAYFLIIPRVRNIRRALILALGANILGNAIFFLAPENSVAAVVAGTLAVAFGMGVAGPVTEAVLANSVSDSTRAIALSFIYTLMYAVTAPFGWIAGQVAAVGPRLPALLAAGVMVCAASLAFLVEREKKC